MGGKQVIIAIGKDRQGVQIEGTVRRKEDSERVEEHLD